MGIQFFPTLICYGYTNIDISKEFGRFTGTDRELVEEIHAKSGILVLNRADGGTWEPFELSALNEALDMLPEAYRRLKTIYVLKDKQVLTVTERDGQVAKVRINARELRISNFNLKGRSGYVEDFTARKLFLMRNLIRGLTYFYDNDHRISESWEWRKISGWTGYDLFGNSAENINEKGFANKLGMKNPREDFVTFAEAFFMPVPGGETLQDLGARLPGKFEFFLSLFNIKTDSHQELESYRGWIDPDNVEQVELLVAAPTVSDIASIEGHLLLLFRQKGDLKMLSKVISFVAMDDPADQGLKFAYKGIFGHYDSGLQEETLAEVIERGTIFENRNIYRFKLNLSPGQVKELIKRFWEIKKNFAYRYYFFNLNCSTMLLKAINYVLPKEEQIADHDFIDAPLDVMRKVFQNKKIGEFVYPEYWSQINKARYDRKRNRDIREEFVTYIKKITGKANNGLALSFNELFQDTFSNSPEIDRAESYEKLVNLYFLINDEYAVKNTSISGETYYKCGKLLLEYLFNSLSIERYLGDPEVKTKRANSKETKSVITQIFKLRMFLEDLAVKLGIRENIRDLSSEAGREFTDHIIAGREDISFTGNYYQSFLSPSYFLSGGEQFTGLLYQNSVIKMKMGDNSIFASRPDTSMELLTFSINPMFLENGAKFDMGMILFKYDQILTGSSVDYNGLFNRGFGFTIWDAKSDLLKEMPLDVSVLESRFILNVFESREFRKYLNLTAGAGYSFTKDKNGNRTDYLDFKIGLDSKFHLFGNTQNVLRLSAVYQPRTDLKEVVKELYTVNSEATFGMGKYSNSLLSIGASYQLERDKAENTNNQVYADLFKLYVTLRFDTGMLFNWFDIKEKLNAIF